MHSVCIEHAQSHVTFVCVFCLINASKSLLFPPYLSSNWKKAETWDWVMAYKLSRKTCISKDNTIRVRCTYAVHKTQHHILENLRHFHDSNDAKFIINFCYQIISNCWIVVAALDFLPWHRILSPIYRRHILKLQF